MLVKQKKNENKKKIKKTKKCTGEQTSTILPPVETNPHDGLWITILQVSLSDIPKNLVIWGLQREIYESLKMMHHSTKHGKLVSRLTKKTPSQH